MAASMGALIEFGFASEQYEGRLSAMDINEDILDAAGLRGTRSHVSERKRQSTRAPRFTITMEPNSVELDALLPRILGGTEVADAFPLAETLPTFTANIDLATTAVLAFTGCVVDKATFESQQGGHLKLTLEVEALEVATGGTSPTAGVSTVGPYIHSDCVMSVNASALNFRSVKLTIDNMLKKDRFFNSQTRISLPSMDRLVTWEFDGPYGDNSALYGLTAAGVACVATWTLVNRSLAFTSNKVAFPRRLPMVQDRDEIMLPLVGMAGKDGSTAEITCVNDSTP